MTPIKTAMQELIEWANYRAVTRSLIAPHEIINKANELLEKEKQMIIRAVNDSFYSNEQKGFIPDGEDYYNQTFKQ
jgi:hypothetical protein